MIQAPNATRLVGSVLSRRWRLVRPLGEGAIGEVYAAEPLSGGSPVAVKLLRSEFLAQPTVLARFTEEGRRCVHLVHPNIARVFECAMAEDGQPYLVIELLEGVLLGAYTQRGGRVPIAQAAAIMQGILAGLAVAHAHGVAHGDLKPDNVLLTRHPNGTFVVKVLDFGIGKVMDAAGGMGSRTRSGMLLGSPAYMSPEQARRTGDIDPRTDVWSAGVILYEMLTGRVAFPAPTEYARLAAVLSAEPESMGRIDAGLAPMREVVARALKKNRSERFESALEMARALAAVSPNEARADGGLAGPAASAVQPLSRLPDVPSLFSPYAIASSAASPLAQTAPAPGTAEQAPVGRQKPGGTLASAAEPTGVAEPAPLVTVASIEGTLPSKSLPALVSRAIRRPRGVAPTVVLVLVAGALAAGFFLGWTLARMG
jgi:serine/threonine protein kinase